MGLTVNQWLAGFDSQMWSLVFFYMVVVFRLVTSFNANKTLAGSTPACAAGCRGTISNLSVLNHYSCWWIV